MAAEALAGTRRALWGARSNYRRLWVLALMGGVVGAGASPPPLGLLDVARHEPALRAVTVESPVFLSGMGVLGALLLALGGFGRSFTLALLQGIRTGEPRPSGYRQYLKPGVAHFVWSSAVAAPLLGGLFWAEARAMGGVPEQIALLLQDPNAEVGGLLGLLAAAVMRFGMVLVPWVVGSLPFMVLIFEWTPAAMVLEGTGPRSASLSVVRAARRRPRLVGAFLLARLLLQMAGNWLALLALIPATPLAAVVSGPVLGLCWWTVSSVGLQRGLGAAAAAIGIMAGSLALYAVLCALLLPLGILTQAASLTLVHRLLEPDRDGCDSVHPGDAVGRS